MVDTKEPAELEKHVKARPGASRRRTFQATRPRGLLSQIGLVLTQPGAFFQALPAVQHNRQWLWVALAILALVGLSAVQQSALATDAEAPGDLGGMPVGGEFGAGAPGGGEFGLGAEGGFVPPAPVPGGDGASAAGNETATRWATALLAAGGEVLQWAVLALLLSEASLLSRRTPALNRNWQIVVWASLPLGLMAGLQLIYYAAGGMVGAPGVAGLLSEIPGYDTWPVFARELLRALASNLTLFWLWSLGLVYIGARRALGGRRWAVGLVLLIWVAVLVFTPAAYNTLTAEEPTPTDEAMPGMGEQGMEGSEGQGFEGQGFEGQGLEGQGLKARALRVKALKVKVLRVKASRA
ncbi:MAG: YIP1 family protein [Anaerolineae bacterium]|nr:YIP1 family protein [Anaerolineae bacterium]